MERSIQEPSQIDYVGYVSRFLRAAELIPDDTSFLQPRLHLYGIAMELALKAFLTAKQAKVPHIHDLEKLLTQAECVDLQLSDSQRGSVVPMLNSIYFEGNPGKYRARSPRPGTDIHKTPKREFIAETIVAIADQVRPGWLASRARRSAG